MPLILEGVLLSGLKICLSFSSRERRTRPHSPLEVELLQIWNRTDSYALSTSLGEPYVS